MLKRSIEDYVIKTLTRKQVMSFRGIRMGKAYIQAIKPTSLARYHE